MLDAISPVDGRYRRHTSPLSPWMSEYGLIHHRVEVEVEYFLALVRMELPQLKDFPKDRVEDFRDVYRQFSWMHMGQGKRRHDNHDVKDDTSSETWKPWGLANGRNLCTLD